LLRRVHRHRLRSLTSSWAPAAGLRRRPADGGCEAAVALAVAVSSATGTWGVARALARAVSAASAARL